MLASKNDRSIQKAVTSVKTDLPTVALRSYSSAGSDLARVVVDVTHTSASRKDPSLVASAIRAKLNNKFEAIAGTFRVLDKGFYTDRLTGVVGVVRQIIAVDEQSMKGFTAVASNMFMDVEKDMWVLKKTAAGDLLVRTTAEDEIELTGLLDAVASAGFRNTNEYRMLAAQCSSVASELKGGDFASYVDYNNQIVHGFVVATTDEDEVLVLQPGAEDPEVIKASAVVEIHDTSEIPEIEESDEEIVDREVAVASGKVDVEYLVNYYKKVYGHNAKFFAEFAKRIRNHAFF